MACIHMNHDAANVCTADEQMMTPQERQRAFAMRFRTEMCRTYVATGRCEYRDRCMFAHGNNEIRTEAMNEAEGLIGDKAIRGWMRERRAHKMSNRRGHGRGFNNNNRFTPVSSVPARTSHPMPRLVGNIPQVVEVIAAAKTAKLSDSPIDSDFFSAPSAASSMSRSSVSSTDDVHPTTIITKAVITSSYRYNPYSLLRTKVFTA